MRFSTIEIGNDITSSVGLDEILMERLGSIVALVGKNGSGKTRILNLLDQNLDTFITINRILDNSISNLPDFILPVISELKPYKEYLLLNEKLKKYQNLKVNGSIGQEKENSYSILKAALDSAEKKLYRDIAAANSASKDATKIFKETIQNAEKMISKLRKSYFNRINYDEIRHLKEILDDSEHENSSFEKLIENIAGEIDYNKIKSIQNTSLTYLQRLPQQLLYDFNDCNCNYSKFENRTSYKRYLGLKKLFLDFFGKDLTWEILNLDSKLTEKGVESSQSGVWKLDNRNFSYAEFSEGEKSLFIYVLLFFLLQQNPMNSLNEAIIIIDEPELHLHPEMEIKLIQGMRNFFGEKGQILIATHSINILSNLYYEEVFLVKGAKVLHPSSNNQKDSIVQLMGVSEMIDNLSQFLTSSFDWAFVNFMIQCFTNPEVIQSAKKDDPQVKLFKTAIESLSTNKEKVLLDFGAGKGRLYKQLALDKITNSEIDYSAYEPNPTFKEQLNTLGIKNVYQKLDTIPKNTFSFILLCNVLHEINIGEWASTLNKIILSLKDDGYLMIMEARFLSKGEMIRDVGFLVLDIGELKELFALESNPSSINAKSDSNDIYCAIIPKSDLNKITNANIINALLTLEKNTFHKLEKIREETDVEDRNLKSGRISAFYSQLYINSIFAQRKLSSFP